MLKRCKRISWVRFLLTVSVLLLDQVSKYYIQAYMLPGETIKIFPYLNFYLIYNPGITFGLLAQWQSRYYLLFLIGFLHFCIMLYIYQSLKKTFQASQYEKWYTLSYAGAVGGGLGNLLDRILQSKVTDFIDFHIGHWHFYTFNIADMGLVFGFLSLGFLMKLKSLTDYEKVASKAC